MLLTNGQYEHAAQPVVLTNTHRSKIGLAGHKETHESGYTGKSEASCRQHNITSVSSESGVGPVVMLDVVSANLLQLRFKTMCSCTAQAPC